jgi:hypothetical protein
LNSFTAKYNVNKLVYLEFWKNLEGMVRRERRLKEWHRNWKIKLIVQKNPNWNDYYQDFLDEKINPEYWIPEHANLTTEQVKEFNRQLRDKDACGAMDPGLRRDDDCSCLYTTS